MSPLEVYETLSDDNKKDIMFLIPSNETVIQENMKADR